MWKAIKENLASDLFRKILTMVIWAVLYASLLKNKSMNCGRRSAKNMKNKSVTNPNGSALLAEVSLGFM